MNTKLFFGLTLTLGALLILPYVAQAGDLSFTVATTTTSDNLSGQSDATWRFTINNSTTLSTSTDAVEITFPWFSAAPPWNFGGMTASSTALGGDLLTFSTSSPDALPYVDQGQDYAKIILMASTTQTSADNNFVIDIKGVTNPIPQMSSFGNVLWLIRTCTLNQSGNPSSGCQSNLDPSSGTVSNTNNMPITRRGGYIDDWSFTASSYTANATSTYTITFTASTTLAAGEKIWVNFPVGFNVASATTSDQNISGSAWIKSSLVTATTTNNLNAVIATTSDAAISAGATVTLAIGNIKNPAKNAYQGLRVFTTTANNGLVDGALFGETESGFGYKPPPVDGIQIGGTNTLIGQVKVQTSTTTRNLTAAEAVQIQVGMGCPDKMFFAGTKRLNSQGVFTYDHLLDATYMMGVMPYNTNDPTFFANYLQPNRLMVSLTGSETATVTPTFIVPDGVLRGVITGGPASYNSQMIGVRAYTGSSETFSPLFTDTNYSTQGLDSSGRGYFQIPIKTGDTWNFAMMFGDSTYLTYGGNQYWASDVSPLFIATSTSYVTNLSAWAFVVPDKTINVTLQDQNGNAITGSGGGPNPGLSIKRAGSEVMGPGGMGATTTTNVGGVDVYQLKTPAGAFSIQVMMPGMGVNEYPVTVLSTDTTINRTIIVNRSTTYITGTITDPDSFAIQGASVMAQGSTGFFSQGMTNSSGVYTLYVPTGVYQVQAFAPGYGFLGTQTVTLSGSSATQNFTISAGNFKKISGTVTVGGTGSEGVYINAYGTSGGNQTMTRSDGTYTLTVPSGTYTVEAWSKTLGFIGRLTNVDASSDISGKNFTAAAQGNLQITISNAGTLGLSEFFASAYSTSTGKGGGSNTWNATTTADLATVFSMPAGYYKVDVVTPGYGNLTSLAANTDASSTAITAGATTYLTIALPDFVTLSGTVTANATVWASRTDGPGKFNTASTSDGNYSLKLPSGYSYMVGASLPGYVNTPITLTNFSATTTQNLTLTQSAYTISGTVSDSSGAVSEGFAWATKANNGGWIGSEISANGSYSLGVDDGTWTVYASAPCLQASNGTTQTGSGTVNFTLTSISGCNFVPPEMSSIVPSNGGTVATSGVAVNIPANALGTGTTNVSFNVGNPTTVPPATLNATPIGNAAKTITASDSNGTSISNLSNSIEISITYSASDIPAGSEDNLQLAYWNTTTGTWDPVAATLDTTNNTLTGMVDHLSDFAPIIPVGDDAPDTPAGLTAAADGDTKIDLSWTAVSEATSYLIYRDTSDSGSFPYLGTNTSNSYEDTGLTAASTYFYKVSASNAGGESAASSATSATTCSGVSHGTISGSSCAITCDGGYGLNAAGDNCVGGGGGSPSLGGGGGGGAIAPVIPPQTPTPTPTPTASPVSAQIAQVPTTATPSITAAPSVIAVSVSPVFTKTMKVGTVSSDAMRLQQILNSDPETKVAESGAGSPGNETNYFGSLTRAALQKFQCKYGIVCSGTSDTTGYGNLGPKTRAKIQEIFEKRLEVKQEVQQKLEEQTPEQAQAIEQLQKQIQELLKQIEQLQAQQKTQNL